MKDQTISIKQMQEIANGLKTKEYAFSHVPDADQLIVTIRETDEQVSKLKNKSDVLIELTYLEEHDRIVIALHLDTANDSDTIFATTNPHESLVEYLEKVANGDRSIQINVIGDDLSNISSRHYFESPIAKVAVSREISKIKSIKK